MKQDKILSQAIHLRKGGCSLREISEQLKISKSTASLWVREVIISKDGTCRLNKISNDARKRALKTNENKRSEILKSININCTALKNPKKHSKDLLKIYLSLLFWGEGSKKERRLTFTNSDPKMIVSYLYLLRKSFNIDESKFRAVIHLHPYHNYGEMLKFWVDVTKIKNSNITIYKKKNSGIRKSKNYKGCISVRYYDVNILDELFIIIERFKKLTNAGVV